MKQARANWHTKGKSIWKRSVPGGRSDFWINAHGSKAENDAWKIVTVNERGEEERGKKRTEEGNVPECGAVE